MWDIKKRWKNWERKREMENRQSGWRRKRMKEYIATVSGIFTNFFCRQQFQVAAAASPHPSVMYRWLSEPDWLHAWTLALPLSPLSTSFLLCVLFLSPHSDIHSLHSVELYFIFPTHLFSFSQLLFLLLSLLLEMVGSIFMSSQCACRVTGYNLQENVNSPY